MKLNALVIIVLCIATVACASNRPGSQATSSAPATAQALGAVGIGVSNLAASSAFYQEVLGLEVLRTYELGYINEIVLGYPQNAGAVLVLMHWPGDTKRQYQGGDVKVVFYVDDPAAVIDRIRTRGWTIDREARPHPALGGRLVGLARDPDNYVVEVLER